MGSLKKLFQQTFIYGLATVLPRMLSFILVPLYTDILPKKEYGEVSIIFSWIILFNVILSYGMETAFFRFFNKEKDKKSVISTATVSLIISSLLFLVLAFSLKDQLASWSGIKAEYISYTIIVLALDALVIVPFAWLRANQQPMRFAVMKILNVAVNLGLNVFFLLLLPEIASETSTGILDSIYRPDFKLSYIFISMLIASAINLIILIPFYFKIKYTFSKTLWKEMLKYSYPVLFAGIAFAINESFDRILLGWLLPSNIAEGAVGAYSACYKLAIFMALFSTAFRMGVEPFFFSKATDENAPETYALITRYFVAFGSIILLTVIIFLDLLKELVIRNSDYWEAMKIVPLILLANFCMGIYHNLSVWYKVTDRTKMGAYISIVGAVVTLGINYALIPTMSYVASAIATVSAYGIMMFLSYYLGQKYYPIPYNLKKISLYFLVSVIFSGISFYLFRSNYIVGIGLWLAFIILIYTQEEKALKKIILRR
ncbi:oligosaccharide flippase family protein [Gillisia sp. CAL575]|uniref:oligosaccharide flippase family protein n=1 Tax=Gillisia sp. CAL575 TaxID=985255 RepID=UPI0005563D8B|nr:oligosaccharide flippase family protein [Gillisia sp. CAL575]